MNAELVVYEKRGPTFTDTVTDFASAIHPLVGLSKLVAKVMASRVEAKRLGVVAARDRHSHDERMEGIRSQTEAIKHHSGLLFEAKMEEIRARDRADLRNGVLIARELELGFDAAMERIRVESSTRRYEVDQFFAIEMRRIDAIFEVQIAKLAEDRRRTNQEFALARRRADARERSLDQIHSALAVSLQWANPRRNPDSVVEMAHGTVRALSNSLTLIHGTDQDALTAILGSLGRHQAS